MTEPWTLTWQHIESALDLATTVERFLANLGLPVSDAFQGEWTLVLTADVEPLQKALARMRTAWTILEDQP